MCNSKGTPIKADEGILYLAPFHSFDNRIPPNVKTKLSH